MAKILRCPGCQSSMDVTSVAPGSTVRCPDCGQTAKVPAGATSVAVKTVSAPIPPPAPAPAPRERGTRIRERGRSSATMQAVSVPPAAAQSHGLLIGLGIGAVAVIVVALLFTMKSHEEPVRPPAPPAPKGPAQTTWNPPLPAGSDKPLVLRNEDGKTTEPKATVVSRPTETADNANWEALMRDLRPGGGFDHLDRPEGVAFQKVKGFGKAAYPKLIGYIDHEQPEYAIAAVAVLNALTGRDSPLPKGTTKAKIKAEWEEWLKSAEAAKPDAPKDTPK